MKKKILFLIFSLFAIMFVSCSSAPKRPMLVTDTYNLAYSKLELANEELLSGNFATSFDYLTESYNLALSIDNPSLLCKICLSGVSYKILEIQAGSEPVKSEKESFLDGSLDSILDEAKFFAGRSTDKSFLLDLCAVYEVKSKLHDENSDKNNLLGILNSSEKSVSKEPYYDGFLERTRGDVYMAMENYENARKSYVNAAEIHTKKRYIYEIGLDWYGAARASSLSGDKKNAVSAIESALKFDRDAENSAAISLDYLAYSKILLKGNPTEEDVKRSAALKTLSEKISAASEKF